MKPEEAGRNRKRPEQRPANSNRLETGVDKTALKLFDSDIIRLKKDLEGLRPHALYEELPQGGVQAADGPDLSWRMKEQPILRSEMAYELGGGNTWALGGLAFTEDDMVFMAGAEKGLGACSGVYLAGPDLNEIQKDISYARFTIVKLAATGREAGSGEDFLYRAMRKVDYVKYRIHPEGYLLRISSVREREPVRVSREALAKGLSFEKVGRLFLQEYLNLPEVEQAQVYFITAPEADYGGLYEYARRFERITDSLDHIFTGLQMDCNTCGLKAVCDEVEGLRELHFGRQAIGM